MPPIRSQARRYAIALAIIALAIALRFWLDPMMGVQGVAIFLFAILIAAWNGGVGPAIMTVVLLHLVHAYAFPSSRGLWEPTLASVISTSAYYLIAITVGVLSQLREAAQGRAREQQLEAISQREQLHITVACIADGVLVTDVEGRVTLMNPAAEAMTGQALADCQGKPWRDVLNLQRATVPDAINRDDVDRPIDRVLREGRIVQGSDSLRLASHAGQTIPIAYSAAPIQGVDGRITGAVLIFRDESDRLRAELALRTADRRKDEFLATLAHELRNPLAPIAAGLELLGDTQHDPEASEEIRQMMQRQTQHMVRLIDDLMDVSRVTRGKLELRRSQIAIADVIRNAVEATRPLMDQAEHRLTVQLPGERLLLHADANRLTQVLTNLLSNAAKYTPPKGRIELSAEREGGDVLIAVSDTGIGIPADKLQCVFEMFAQIHEGGEYGHAGLGIGLSLVNRLVEMHGGSVEVESPGSNLGSTFRVRLPALQEPHAEGGGAPHKRLDAPSPPIRRRVLIVDDNADVLESLSRLVARMGNEVCRARDGLEAIELAQSFRPEIVLMDLGMPHLNGYEAARRMRQEPWGQELTLVATSGWGQDGDRRRTAEAGFDRHLVKPIDTAALREVLHSSTPRPTAPTLPASAPAKLPG
jgi:PAS domain S-box-containing protein